MCYVDLMYIDLIVLLFVYIIWESNIFDTMKHHNIWHNGIGIISSILLGKPWVFHIYVSLPQGTSLNWPLLQQFLEPKELLTHNCSWSHLLWTWGPPCLSNCWQPQPPNWWTYQTWTANSSGWMLFQSSLPFWAREMLVPRKPQPHGSISIPPLSHQKNLLSFPLRAAVERWLCGSHPLTSQSQPILDVSIADSLNRD